MSIRQFALSIGVALVGYVLGIAIVHLFYTNIELFVMLSVAGVLTAAYFGGYFYATKK